MPKVIQAQLNTSPNNSANMSVLKPQILSQNENPASPSGNSQVFQASSTSAPDENNGLEEEVKVNDGSASSNVFQADQGTVATRTTAPPSTLCSDMLACLKRKGSKADIEWKFFSNKDCNLCGKHVNKRIMEHIRYHIEGKSHIKTNYSFCLQADGKTLQVQCKTCSQKFPQTSVEILQGHSQACNPNSINLNERPVDRSVDRKNDNDIKALEKKYMTKIDTLQKRVTALESKQKKTDKKLAGVFRTQGAEKKRLDVTEKRVEVVEQGVKVVEEKVENHENTLVGLLNHLINQGLFERPREAVTSSNIFDRLRPARREEERDRERSRERARRGSQERTTRQNTRHRNEERHEERRTARGEDSSRERSSNTRGTRHHNNRGQAHYGTRSQRRHN